MPDFTTKSDNEIQTWIENHEQKGVTDTQLYKDLLEERSRRKSKLLNVEKSLQHLMQAAQEARFTTYGELAIANGVPWNKARHHMNGSGGHLDQLLDVCHARGLPLFSAICVNQQGVSSGRLEESAMDGFIAGVKRLGVTVTDREQFLKKCQENCFEWGHDNQSIK
jgi:hypothetical protein